MNDTQTWPVRDEACEEIVIGTLLNRSIEWHRNADLLSDELFTNNQYKCVFKAAKALIDKGEQADIIFVTAELERHNPTGKNAVLVADISNHVAFTDLRPKLLRLQELRRRRELWRIGQHLIQTGINESELVEDVQTQTMDELSRLFVTASTSIKPIADIASDFTTNVVQGNRQGTHKVGILTGFKSFDDKGGMQLSDMVVIAADSSQGKTSFAINIAENAAKGGNSVAFYSMEMTAAQLYSRIMSAETGIPSNVLNTRPLDNAQLAMYNDTSKRVSHLPIFFDERSTSSLENILASIRTMVYRKNVHLAIVDYLQILNVNTKNVNKEQAMADAARRFKNLAKELNICIVLLSQLSRDRDNPRPNIARLRDSGQIAEAADVVMLIYRPIVYGTRYEYPEPYKNIDTSFTAMIDVCKGRNIGQLTFIVKFVPSLTLFKDLPQDNLPDRKESGYEDPDEDIPF